MSDNKEDMRRPGRLEWIYDPGAAHVEKSALDLMNEAVDLGKEGKSNSLRATSSASLFISDIHQTSNDTLRRIREDPLFAIKQQEVRQRQQLVNNPLLRERVKEDLRDKLKMEKPKRPWIDRPHRSRSRSRERQTRPRITQQERDIRLKEMLQDGKKVDSVKLEKVNQYTKHFKH